MNVEKLYKLAGREEVDYQLLLSILKNYSRPRDKISDLLKSGDLIRVKKGLYVFSREVSSQYFSEEVIANLIYGPSAISLSTALAYYGLIPERTEVITNITNKRNKIFETPIGIFTYSYLNYEKYSIGIELIEQNDKKHILMASPEKALCDHIHLIDRKISFNSLEEVEAYLLYDLRLDESQLRKFRISYLTQISNKYQDKRLHHITKFIAQWK